MEKQYLIKEIADCLEKDSMRHFFDKRKRIVILSISQDEIVNFIEKEVERLKKDKENYIEFTALKRERMKSLMHDFANRLKDSEQKSKIFDLLIDDLNLRQFDRELKSYPDIHMEWLDFKDTHLEELAINWLKSNKLI